MIVQKKQPTLSFRIRGSAVGICIVLNKRRANVVLVHENDRILIGSLSSSSFKNMNK